ncbi:MAG: flagellar basal body rod protein FlgB [Spirochaetales bacterium]|nr:MAG: flagellar basal body rod protein FlgB [Spirochaetales bacterium]
MFLQNSFGKNVDLLHRSMDVAMLRRDVIANNLANADTPNFKRTVVNFESSLKRALDSERESAEAMPAIMTDPRHIPFTRPIDYRTVMPRRVLDYLTATDNNGNNVDLEEENMLALHNQLNYNLMVQSVSYEFSQINSALRLGG